MREFANLPDSVPFELKKIVKNSLEKLPENRYKTVEELHEDLRQFLRGNSQSVLPETPPTEPVPNFVKPTADNPDSVVTSIKTPSETDETITIINNSTPIMDKTPKLTSGLTGSKMPSILRILLCCGIAFFTGFIDGKFFYSFIPSSLTVVFIREFIIAVTIYLFGRYAYSNAIDKGIWSLGVLVFGCIIGDFVSSSFRHYAFGGYYNSQTEAVFVSFTSTIIYAAFIVSAELIS